MDKLKSYLKDKGIGFYFSACITLLLIVTAIIYVSSYAGTSDISWWSFVFVLAGIVGAVALVVLKQYNWAPVALAVGSGLGLLFFVHAVSFYVSVVLVGIDADTFSSEFIICTIFFVITFILSVANIFLKQVKKDKVNGEALKA